MLDNATKDIILHKAREHIAAAQRSLGSASYQLSIAEVESLTTTHQKLINIVRELNALDSDVLLALLRDEPAGV